MKLIVDGQLIGDEEIKRIEQTPEGMHRLAMIKISSRVAYAAMQMIGYLKNDLDVLTRNMTYQEREDFCNVLYHSLLKSSQEEIDRYIEECYEHIEEHKFQMPATMGNC